MSDFKVVEDGFLAAAEIPAAKRGVWLDGACAGNPSLKQEVESLLSFDSSASRPLGPILEASAASVFHGARMLGLRIGAYEITEILGHGGMGSVYLAARADDQFRRKVAVKFIRRGMDTPGATERFLRERQILAQLNHPYIGKLLDGGATDEGIPYFVMEYVEGTPIDEFCGKQNLSVEARCELFGKICEAVAYAHRHLVVHRDLKPSNILVNAEGSPVLLDFGIAKILDDAVMGDRSATAGTSMLTPEYASPEQVRGLPTNTSTDVYSLGVLFFQLLTESKPFQVNATNALEMARTVCEQAPPRPSSLPGRHKLAGDLDNIILMALRKEPERRYHSVDQFREDVVRYLKGRPVRAREDTFGYRTGKFVRRNRAGVAAVTLAAGSLIGAVIVTAHEASRANQALRVAESQRVRAEREHQAARRERELAGVAERRAEERAKEANVARGTAQQRLTSIVDLSRRSLFDVQGTLERLPGALEARREVITTTLQFLDRLAVDSGGDPALLDLLTTAYTQSGDVLGLPARPNLGDAKGALQAWGKARAMLTRTVPAGFGTRDKSYLLQDLGLHQRVGMVVESQGDTRRALSEYRAALAIARTLSVRFPSDADSVVQVGMIEHSLGSTLTKTGDASAAEHVRAEVRTYERVTAMVPKNFDHKLGLASAVNALGRLLIARHDLQGGLERYRQALAIREAVAAEHPADSLTQSGLASGQLRIAATLGGPWQENLGDTGGALEASLKAVAILDALSAADPGNRKARGDLARALVYAGAIGGNAAQLRRAIGLLEPLRAEDPKQTAYQSDLKMANEYLGTVAARGGLR